MAKDYSAGYALGQQDGADGNNRLASRSFMRLFRIGAYLPGCGARDDEFIEGYKAGFRDKVRIIKVHQEISTMTETQGRGDLADESRIEREAKRAHENPGDTGKSASSPPPIAILNEQVKAATDSILTGGTSMSNSFAHQKELLLNLKHYLGQFQERLLGVAGSYQSKLDELHGAGMMDETYRKYVESELAQTQSLIKNLVAHIDANDIPKVQKEIDFLDSH